MVILLIVLPILFLLGYLNYRSNVKQGNRLINMIIRDKNSDDNFDL